MESDAPVASTRGVRGSSGPYGRVYRGVRRRSMLRRNRATLRRCCRARQAQSSRPSRVRAALPRSSQQAAAPVARRTRTSRPSASTACKAARAVSKSARSRSTAARLGEVSHGQAAASLIEAPQVRQRDRHALHDNDADFAILLRAGATGALALPLSTRRRVSLPTALRVCPRRSSLHSHRPLPVRGCRLWRQRGRARQGREAEGALAPGGCPRYPLNAQGSPAAGSVSVRLWGG